MLGNAHDPLLQQAEQGIQSKVAPNMQGPLSQVVHAGLTVLYAQQNAAQLQKRIAAITDPAKEAGDGSARMLSNLYQQSNKTMPKQVIVPAAMIMAFEFLDLCAKAGKAQITPDLVAKTAQATADAIMPLFGITKDMLANGMKVAQQKAAGALPAAPSAPAPGGIISQAQAGA